MNCPECGKSLLPGVPFCRCGWPESRDGSGRHYWDNLAEHHRLGLREAEGQLEPFGDGFTEEQHEAAYEVELRTLEYLEGT
jgi:hypothetical protein